MEQDNIINFTDEDGKLRPLEDIKEDLENLYENILEAEYAEDTILKDFINSENYIDSTEVISSFSFLDRTLYLCSEIKHETAIAFSDIIRFWNYVDDLDEIPLEERKPIKIYIDSPGGDLDATFSIIDSIELSKTPIWTITIGSGNSGSFFIGITGHKRFGYPNSSFLFHEGACSNGADAHKYIQFTEFYKKKLSMLKKVVLAHTKFSPDDYEKYKKDDLWLTAEEALDYGIIDEIAKELI